jgi:hypothetical protein
MYRVIASQLKVALRRSELVNHRFFREFVNDLDVTRDGVAIGLCQWRHPLHYFPTFLSRSRPALGLLAQTSGIADVLHEELGQGIPARAHEPIYVNTVGVAGFSSSEVSQTPRMPATVRLVQNHETCSANPLTALDCIYATQLPISRWQEGQAGSFGV